MEQLIFTARDTHFCSTTVPCNFLRSDNPVGLALSIVVEPVWSRSPLLGITILPHFNARPHHALPFPISRPRALAPFIDFIS